jgi:hypothetical protein
MRFPLLPGVPRIARPPERVGCAPRRIVPRCRPDSAVRTVWLEICVYQCKGSEVCPGQLHLEVNRPDTRSASSPAGCLLPS